MKWKLIKCVEEDCILDNSNIYTVIYRTPDGLIRLDIMTIEGELPIMSFTGTAEAVRKTVINWLVGNDYGISCEHCSYIGSELARAELIKNYIQG